MCWKPPPEGGRPGLLRDHMIGRAAKVGHVGRRVLQSGICLGVATCVGFAATVALAESLPEALAKAYQSNPHLNAERARQRATDENVPQALAGYRPQIIASLSGGLQAIARQGLDRKRTRLNSSLQINPYAG